MGLREELQRKYDKKVQENIELEMRIRENNSYLQGLQDALRLVGRESSHQQPPLSTINQPLQNGAGLRQGSMPEKALMVLREEGRALHVDEILSRLGKPVSRNSKAALAGTLSPYVRRGEVFTRPAPNTFGLVEFPQEFRPILDSREFSGGAEIGDTAPHSMAPEQDCGVPTGTHGRDDDS